MRKNWTIRLATLLLWLLAAASGVFWALKLVQGTAVPANAAVVSTVTTNAIDSAALAKGLGGGLVAPSATPSGPSGISAARFVLTGIVTGSSTSENLALIAVDGKPARPYRIGAALTDGVVLKSLDKRQVALAASTNMPASVTLEMPKQTSAVAGSAMPAPPRPQPTPAPPPTVTLPMATVPDPTATAGQNLARPGAIRPRPSKEAGKEMTRGEPAAQTGAATQ
jgi:general secretion pathway protein C